jgi:diacylglycerol kinase
MKDFTVFLLAGIVCTILLPITIIVLMFILIQHITLYVYNNYNTLIEHIMNRVNPESQIKF